MVNSNAACYGAPPTRFSELIFVFFSARARNHGPAFLVQCAAKHFGTTYLPGGQVSNSGNPVAATVSEPTQTEGDASNRTHVYFKWVWSLSISSPVLYPPLSTFQEGGEA